MGKLLGDSSRRKIHALVCPYPEHLPARLGQQPVSLQVPLAVPTELRSPPVGVRTRPRRVLGATVPEAAVHEDGHSPVLDYEISTPSDRRNRPGVLLIWHAQGVQLTT